MERIGSLLPLGPGDDQVHRGARRRSSRFRLDAEVTLLEPGPGEGLVLNASAGGLRVAVDLALEVGDHCLVLVRLRSGKTSFEHGRVVWVKELAEGCVAGLEFVMPD